VARDRLRDRIVGRRLDDRVGPRRRRVETGEERLAYVEQRRRIAGGERALAQVRASVEPARIPRERLAQLVNAHLLWAVLADEIRVASPDAAAFRQRGRSGIGLPLLERDQRLEQPRVAHGA